MLTLRHAANAENGYVCVCNSLSFRPSHKNQKNMPLIIQADMLCRDLCLSALLMFLYKTSKLEIHPSFMGYGDHIPFLSKQNITLKDH